MRRLLVLAVASWAIVSPLGAQPTAPTPSEVKALRSASVVDPQRAANATPLTVNLNSREEVRQFYRAIYGAAENTPLGWTGSYASGTAGTTSDALKEAVRLRVNFFRAFVGVPAIIDFNSTFSAKAQQAALMMSVNNALSHTPPASWNSYTAAGAEGALNSNLALGSNGPDAVSGYMADPGANNTAVGHRRWVIYPPTRQMGTGDVPGNGTLQPANALWVIDGQFGTARPATRTTHLPYPPAGFVPYQLVWPRWSFSYPGADFSSASVTMSRSGQNVPVTLEPLAQNVGEPTLVWVYNGLDSARATAHAKPASDTPYLVNVSNVRIGTTTQNFSYSVTVFDPDSPGSDFVPVAVTGSATPTVGATNTYAVTKPAFASGFDWRASLLASFDRTYGAENGLDGIVATTSAGYPVVQSAVAGAGAASFHLAHPSPVTNQILTLPDLFLVTDASASISFLSRLALATSLQVARVQVSTNDGTSWNDLFAQAGTGDAGESTFRVRSVALASYAAMTVRVRFSYTFSSNGSFFPQTTAGVGWYLDNITLTGVQSVTAGATNPGEGGSTFAFTPAAPGTVALQARGVLFDGYPLEWGPSAIVTAAAGTGGGATGYLSNLSVRSKAGTGAQTLIVGFAVSGGSKPLLVRGIGPGLITFGVPDTISDPKLELYAGQTLMLENDNWPATAAPIFTSVGAFSLPDASRDAALVTTVAPGSYSAQVTGFGGSTGVALVELYDTAAGTAARLVNVSARSQVGTGGEILIAGFNVGGTGRRQLLIRAIGPTLAVFGVGGVLGDPKLDLYQGTTLLQSNDNWDAAAAGTFGSVGAFNLTTGSKDAVLLVTLDPGGYTAQVSGVGNTTGVALVEVYEVP